MVHWYPMRAVHWLGWVLFLLTIGLIGLIMWLFYTPEQFTAAECTVAGIAIQGELYTYGTTDAYGYPISTSENLLYLLEQAEAAPNISVVLLEVDSPGGSPVAAEEIERYIKYNMSKPVVAQIRELGASAAYWAASAADIIFASSLSNVGSIGASMSYTDNSIVNEETGYTFNEINSGKFKDAGNPEKPLTEEERALFQRDVDIIHNAFTSVVADNRGLDVEQVRMLADGSTVLGEMAKDRGLVDRIGGIEEVKTYIRETHQIEPEICWE